MDIVDIVFDLRFKVPITEESKTEKKQCRFQIHIQRKRMCICVCVYGPVRKHSFCNMYHSLRTHSCSDFGAYCQHFWIEKDNKCGMTVDYTDIFFVFEIR